MSATRDRLERAEQARARTQTSRGNAVPAGLRPRRSRRALRLAVALALAAACAGSAWWLSPPAAPPVAPLELELAEPQHVGAGAADAAPPGTAPDARIESLALERDRSGTRLRLALDAPAQHRLEVSASGREVALILSHARLARELARLDLGGSEIEWLDLRPEPPDLRVVMGLREPGRVSSASYEGNDGATLVLDIERATPAAVPAAPAAEPDEAAPAPAAAPLKRRASLPDAEAHYAAALAAERVGRIDEAAAELASALAERPGNAAARLRLAQLDAARGLREEALRLLRAGRELEPARADLALLEARLLAEDQHADQALAALDSIPAAARNADFHAMHAALFAARGEHERAVGEFSTALRLDPRRGSAWLGLAISLEAEKRAPEARAAYRRALAVGGLEPAARAWAEERAAALGSAP